MKQTVDMPGLKLIGEITSQRVNGGIAVPLYEMTEPKDRPSINTADGWNALVKQMHARYREEELAELLAHAEEIQAERERLSAEPLDLKK